MSNNRLICPCCGQTVVYDGDKLIKVYVGKSPLLAHPYDTRTRLYRPGEKPPQVVVSPMSDKEMADNIAAHQYNMAKHANALARANAAQTYMPTLGEIVAVAVFLAIFVVAWAMLPA